MDTILGKFSGKHAVKTLIEIRDNKSYGFIKTRKSFFIIRKVTCLTSIITNSVMNRAQLLK